LVDGFFILLIYIIGWVGVGSLMIFLCIIWLFNWLFDWFIGWRFFYFIDILFDWWFFIYYIDWL